MLHGDLGQSIRLKLPVLDLVKEKLPVTLQLACMAMIIALVIGITAGILSAVTAGSLIDYAVSIASLSGISTPNFWLGIMMIFVFAVKARLAARIGLCQPVRRCLAEPRDHDHAGLRSR